MDLNSHLDGSASDLSGHCDKTRGLLELALSVTRWGLLGAVLVMVKLAVSEPELER